MKKAAKKRRKETAELAVELALEGSEIEWVNLAPEAYEFVRQGQR